MHVGIFGIFGWPGRAVHPRPGPYLQRNCLILNQKFWLKYFCWVSTISQFSVQKSPRMLFYGSTLMHMGSFGIFGWPGRPLHPRPGRYLQRNCLPAPPMIKQTNKNLDWTIFVEFRQFLNSVSKNHLECYSMAPLLCTWAVLAFSAGLADLYILGWVAICKGTACLPHLCIACGRADPAAYVCARLLFSAQWANK